MFRLFLEVGALVIAVANCRPSSLAADVHFVGLERSPVVKEVLTEGFNPPWSTAAAKKLDFQGYDSRIAISPDSGRNEEILYLKKTVDGLVPHGRMEQHIIRHKRSGKRKRIKRKACPEKLPANHPCCKLCITPNARTPSSCKCTTQKSEMDTWV